MYDVDRFLGLHKFPYAVRSDDHEAGCVVVKEMKKGVGYDRAKVTCDDHEADALVVMTIAMVLIVYLAVMEVVKRERYAVRSDDHEAVVVREKGRRDKN